MAYDALVNEKSKFYTSIKTLKEIIVQESLFTEVKHNNALCKIVLNIVNTLRSIHRASKEDAYAVLALYNGFLVCNAVYRSIVLRRRRAEINVNELYNQALKDFDAVLKFYGYNAESIHKQVEKLIQLLLKKNNKNLSGKYERFFKYDFDCYLNQFWVIKDGLINGVDGEQSVEAVVSAVVNEEDIKLKKVLLPSSINKNASEKLSSEDIVKIDRGRSAAKRLELEIGCKLEDLVNDEEFKKCERILWGANEGYNENCQKNKSKYDINQQTLKEYRDIESYIVNVTKSNKDDYVHFRNKNFGEIRIDKYITDKGYDEIRRRDNMGNAIVSYKNKVTHEDVTGEVELQKTKLMDELNTESKEVFELTCREINEERALEVRAEENVAQSEKI